MLRVYRSNRHNPAHKSGCRKGKHDECRARFPRTVHVMSTVDENNGALILKKQEAWINTYSVVLSYLLRCNTDVTCLMSGTMVRAMIAYVTDYITKSSLKTHTMFEVIAAVLAGTPTLVLPGPLTREECARRLLVRIVNGLTAKTEIGAPMACASLLGQPDHYTNKQFKVFFWTSYARIVATIWHEDVALSDSDERTKYRVMINSSSSGLIAHRKANDYVFRPTSMAAWSLVDFLTFTDVVPVHDKDSTRSRAVARSGRPARPVHRFLPEHPKQATHGIRVLHEGDHYVLDFVGAKLPRRDHGDHEIYCRTMLTLFAPCRTGLELRTTGQSWSDSFNMANFTARHLSLMDNMNVLYECRDASHDFAALRRAAAALHLSDTLTDAQPTLRDLCDNANSALPPDPNDLQLLRLVEKACRVSTSSFFSDLPVDVQRQSEFLALFDSDSDMVATAPSESSNEGIWCPPRFVSSSWNLSHWKTRLEAARKHALSVRLNPTLAIDHSNERSTHSQCNVRVLTNEDLDQFSSPVDSLAPQYTQATPLMMRVVHDFSLNPAQRRAFALIASRLVSANPTPLRMYIGGMGGTGKSRVVNALTAFFAHRGEPFRFRVMAPTGSAAAQIGGSTYHSLFGFNKGASSLSRTRLAALKEMHTGTDLFLLDEISMMSVGDFYNLSERMCKIFDSMDAFGGKHMVVFGDFGQLPPPCDNGKALYSAQIPRVLSGDLQRTQSREHADSVPFQPVRLYGWSVCVQRQYRWPSLDLEHGRQRQSDVANCLSSRPALRI